LGYEPNELPGCSTPQCGSYYISFSFFCKENFFFILIAALAFC
jgi:hypothetical protein